VNPTLNTTYTLNAHNSSGCFGSTIHSISINPLPDVGIGSGLNGDTLCLGMTTSLFATGGSSYLWSTNQTGPIINVSPSATTVYTVTGTNSNGCSKTLTIQLVVRECGEVSGISEASLQYHWRVYPNPASDKIFVTTNDLTEMNWNITDFTGKIVLIGKQLNQHLTEIDTEKLMSGIYFLSINSGNGKVVFKVIKE
jgi:hypothetical protein